MPDDIDVLDELKDVVTAQGTTLGPPQTVASRTALSTAPAPLAINNSGVQLRDEFTITDNVKLDSLTIPLLAQAGLTAGLMQIEICRGTSTVFPGTTLVDYNAIVASLGGVIARSDFIEAATTVPFGTPGPVTFTFSDIVLQPGPYTFFIKTLALDSAVEAQVGQFGGDLEVIYDFQGSVISGLPQDGDVLTYSSTSSQWEASPAYPVGNYNPIVIDALEAPTALNVEDPGVFWRNAFTQRLWISEGGGVWWPIPPSSSVESAAIATRSDAAPAAPADGDLWFSNLTARLYMRDNEAPAWIEI